MKKIPFLSMLLLSLVARSQSKVENLYGKWMEKSVGGANPVECPYRILFEKDGYKIFNVCYGFDPSSPITEHGSWTYDPLKKVITLKNRKAYDNNDLYANAEPILNIHVEDYRTNSITIYFDSEKNRIVLHKTQ